MEREVLKPRLISWRLARSLACVATSCLAFPASVPDIGRNVQPVTVHAESHEPPAEPLIQTVFPVTIYRDSAFKEPYHTGSEVYVFCMNSNGVGRLLPIDGGQVGYGKLSPLDMVSASVRHCRLDGSVPFKMQGQG